MHLYVTALTNFYRKQKALDMNSHSFFCENNVRKYLKFLQKRNAKHDHKQFADKNRNTLLNEYNENEFEQICHELWAHEVFSSECYFCTLMNILLEHYILICDNNQHAAEISDFFIFEFKKEESTWYMFLIFIICAGKQNQHDQLKIIDALQHKKFLICMLDDLTFYFFFLLKSWWWDFFRFKQAVCMI